VIQELLEFLDYRVDLLVLVYVDLDHLLRFLVLLGEPLLEL